MAREKHVGAIAVALQLALGLRSSELLARRVGVTMEEPGVSKVVSVNLHEVGRLQARRRAA